MPVYRTGLACIKQDHRRNWYAINKLKMRCYRWICMFLARQAIPYRYLSVLPFNHFTVKLRNRDWASRLFFFKNIRFSIISLMWKIPWSDQISAKVPEKRHTHMLALLLLSNKNKNPNTGQFSFKEPMLISFLFWKRKGN